jgi:hypothetical protein
MNVYFIRVGQYVKVGFSQNPERRFRRLFSSTTGYSAPWDCPRVLADRTLLGYVPGSKDEEWEAHAALEDFLVGCEFYLAEEPVLDYAARCIKAGRVLTDRVDRPEGRAEFVGQVPPGVDVWTLSDITRARRSA